MMMDDDNSPRQAVINKLSGSVFGNVEQKIEIYCAGEHQEKPAEDNRKVKEEELRDPDLKENMPRGPHKKFLFVKDGRDTKEDTATMEGERERLCGYLSRHCLKGKHLVCMKEDTLNKTIMCFLIKWMERGLTMDVPSGGAVFRFLTEECGIVSDVQEKAYANRINEWLKERNNYDTNVMLMVRRAFIE